MHQFPKSKIFFKSKTHGLSNRKFERRAYSQFMPAGIFSVFELKNNTKFQGAKVMDILVNTIQYIFQ